MTMPAAASAADKKILNFHADKGNGVMATYRDAFQSTVKAGPPDHFTFDEEYMDLWQHSGGEYLSLLHDFRFRRV
jgi:hypothetical protein